MQIIYILCVHATSLAWEKKKSNMCSGGNENQDTFTLLYLHLLILDASFEAFMELTFPFIRCSWLGICWAIPPNLGGRRCKEGGFLFNKQCYYFPPLTAYAKSFVGEKKIPRKKKKRGVCITITTSVPSVFVLFMSGNFLAVLPG